MDLAHLATSTAQVFRDSDSTLVSISDADLALNVSATDADAIDCILVVPMTSTSAAVKAVVDDDSFASSVFSIYEAGIAKAAETAAYDDTAGDAAVAAAAAALAVGRTFASILGANTSDALNASIAALDAANVESLASDYVAPDPPVLAALSLGDLAVLVDAVLAAAKDVVEAVKDEVAVLALANAQEEVNRRRLRKIALATASQTAQDEAEGRRVEEITLATVKPDAMVAALVTVSNQIAALGNATNASGNEAAVIAIAAEIAAAAKNVAEELPTNSEDAAGLMEAVETAEGAVATSGALLDAAAFVGSAGWDGVTETASVTPPVVGTTLGQFPPSAPPPTPPPEPPAQPPPGVLKKPGDGQTTAEVDGSLVAIIVVANLLFLFLVVLPAGYALYKYPGHACTWFRLKTTHSNVRCKSSSCE